MIFYRKMVYQLGEFRFTTGFGKDKQNSAERLRLLLRAFCYHVLNNGLKFGGNCCKLTVDNP